MYNPQRSSMFRVLPLSAPSGQQRELPSPLYAVSVTPDAPQSLWKLLLSAASLPLLFTPAQIAVLISPQSLTTRNPKHALFSEKKVVMRKRMAKAQTTDTDCLTIMPNRFL